MFLTVSSCRSRKQTICMQPPPSLETHVDERLFLFLLNSKREELQTSQGNLKGNAIAQFALDEFSSNWVQRLLQSARHEF